MTRLVTDPGPGVRVCFGRSAALRAHTHAAGRCDRRGTVMPSFSTLTACARTSRWNRGRIGLARNHDLGRLDDRQRIVAPAELQFIQRVTRDDGCQRLIPNSQADLTEQAVSSPLLDEAPEAIATAQRHDE